MSHRDLIAKRVTISRAASKPGIDVIAGWRVVGSTLSTTKEECAMSKQRDVRFAELEEHFAGYTVYNANREKIGKVDDLSVERTITQSTPG